MTDNTVLLVVMTPFTVFILVYLGYALIGLPRSAEGELLEGPPIRGHIRLQIAWLVGDDARGAVPRHLRHGASCCAERLRRRAAARTRSRSRAGPAADSGDRTAVGVHLPLSDVRRRRDRAARAPVDRQIEFHVTSLDAIHSFWAYQLGVKADANPGVDNVAYVKATKTGDVRDSLRRAVRALARLHVRHRPAS